MYCDLYMTPLWRTSCLSEDAVLTWHFQMFTRNSQTVTCNLCSYLFIGFSLGDPKVTCTTVTSLLSLCCARVDKLDVSSVCWRKIFKNKTQAGLENVKQSWQIAVEEKENNEADVISVARIRDTPPLPMWSKLWHALWKGHWPVVCLVSPTLGAVPGSR